LFTALGASASTLGLIHEYMDIWYLFAALVVFPMLCNSAIRATGDTKWPSILMMISGLVNAVLDPILIFGWGPIPAFGIAGAAWATVGAWLFASATAFYLLWHREKLLVFALPPAGELFAVWRNVLVLAMPIALANMLGPVAIGALTAIVARYGEHAVAAFGVGGRVEAFSLVVAFAITAALSPYMAQNLGAGNRARANDALRNCVRFIVAFQLVAYAVLALLARPIVSIFSRDPMVVEVAVRYLYIMPLGVLSYAVIIVINTAFNAHHRSGRTLALSVFRVAGCVVPLSLAGSWAFGLTGVFAGAVTGNALAMVAAWMVYRRIEG
ncbi:MAG: MATE family efflux transporter, partial [Gammaproteobacteria bacterium]|nr:MATE family efflux transporter [Gammaproteobacteria bacterium]